MFDQIGRVALQSLATVGEVSVFAARALLDAVRPPFEFDEFFRQLYELGWRSVPLIAASGVAIGVVMSMHTRVTLQRFGAEAMIPAGLGISVIAEIGPLVTGLLMAGRAGAGIGAELGAMKVTEQIDALEAVAVDAFRFLSVTRVAACVVALPLLTVTMDFAAIAGGYLAETVISGMSFQLYLTRAFSFIGFEDFLPATLKTAVFGFIIAIVGSYLGFTTSRGTEGVGSASTQAVVTSSILIILSDVILVRIILFFFPRGVV
ncbi:MAG TPA: ABC transporter permease [Vicinamibacterales bacterium]|nr:ABC transporter permease [Vicinamibacterales bacterium]